MAKQAKQVTIKNKQLVCPVCNNNMFTERKTQMNTTAATLFKLDWANKNAQNYICDSCGYVYWFLK